MHQDLPPPKSYLFQTASFPLSPFASIIKIPPQIEQKELSYSELVCTDQDRLIIYEIILTVASSNVLKLGIKESYLRKLQEQILHVHPMKFLTSIFNHSELRACMPGIFDSSFKRWGFMDGLAPSMDREAAKGKLLQYLEDFAREIGVTVEELKPFFLSQKWEEMVYHLIDQLCTN